MTAKDMARYLGKTVGLRLESLTFFVQVQDVKSAYGERRFKVAPLDGYGSQWVSESRITFPED